MNALMKKFSHLLSVSSLKKHWKYLLVFISAVTLLSSLSMMFFQSKETILKSIYYIGRESSWQIELLGREKSLMAFTNDLMATIAAENKIRFEWIETNPAHLIDGLDHHSYDFILTTIRPNIINQEKYDFSEILFDLGPVLIVREDSQIDSLKEMQGRPIGVSYGFNTNFNAVRVPGVNVYDLSFIYYNHINNALDALINDHIDGVILQAIPAYALIQGLYAGKIKIVTAPLNDEGLRIASLGDSSYEKIINLFNISLENMRKDGRYKSLIEKWSLIDPQNQFWHTPQEPAS